MSHIKGFIKRELTLCIAFAAAAASCFAVPPDKAYFGYLDFRTLALLYALMVVVAGLRNAGVFEMLAHWLCAKAHTLRAMGFTLVALCFLSSMLITNDVAILTFVPLAVAVLGLAGRQRELAWVVVLQIVAANLGSMLTPVGNPQNLYLYSYYTMSAGTFFSATGPIWLLSAILLSALCCFIEKSPLEAPLNPRKVVPVKPLIIYGGLTVVCMLVVFRVLPWPYMLGAVILTLLVFDAKALKSADFYLLLTFVCFFVFAGNLARVEAVDSLLKSLLKGREMLVGAAASQLISNVPAAILLS